MDFNFMTNGVMGFGGFADMPDDKNIPQAKLSGLEEHDNPDNYIQVDDAGDALVNAEKDLTKRGRRRTTALECLSLKFHYRSAFSEVRLLEAMKYERLKMGHSYNFVTNGDVNSLSYLKLVLNKHNLDYLLMSTWVIAAEDLLQVIEWIKEGRIKKWICILVKYSQVLTK